MNALFNSGFRNDLEAMLQYKVSLGYSRDTYLRHCLAFDRYCCGRFPEIHTLTQPVVLGWIELKSGEQPITVQGRCCFMRTFAKYLRSVGMDAYMLPVKFSGSASMFTPYIFTDGELAALFHEIDSFQTGRDALQPYLLSTVFRLIYTCGLRPREGRTLKRSCVNTCTGEILITETKQHKERIVVMSDEMRELAASYCRIRDAAFPDSVFMFPNAEGNAYSAAWLLKKLKHFFALANPGTDPEMLPHVRVYDLRHRFASAALMRWLDNGEDLANRLPYLRAYMGHNELSATAYYIHILPENLVKSAGIDWSAFGSMIPEVELWDD